MPTIDMSAGFVTGLPQRMLGVGASDNSSGAPALARLLTVGATADTQFLCGEIYLMKGTPPTSFADLPNRDSRRSDALCAFSALGGANDAFNGQTVTNTNPAVINTAFRTAYASGTCTWFWQITHAYAALSETNTSYLSWANALTHQFYGTVGLPGSGADAEIGSLVITAGEQYQIRNLLIQFPTTFTY